MSSTDLQGSQDPQYEALMRKLTPVERAAQELQIQEVESKKELLKFLKTKMEEASTKSVLQEQILETLLERVNPEQRVDEDGKEIPVLSNSGLIRLLEILTNDRNTMAAGILSLLQKSGGMNLNLSLGDKTGDIKPTERNITPEDPEKGKDEIQSARKVHDLLEEVRRKGPQTYAEAEILEEPAEGK